MADIRDTLFGWMGKPYGTQVKEYVYGKGKMPSPPLIVGGIGGTSVFTKMFGTAKTAVPVAASGGISWTTAALGGLAGYGIASLFGGGTSKKDVTQTAAPQSMAPAITPSQVITPVVTQPSYITTTYNQQDYSYSAITDSPFASISKKTGASTSAEPQWYTPVTGSQETPFTGEQGQELSAAQADGTNMALLAGIAAVGLIGYGYVSHRKGGKGS